VFCRLSLLSAGTFASNATMGGGTFFKVGGNKCTLNNYIKFLWFELATVTSQALKYYVISYTPYEGLNYTILDKTTLWKRIGEPPEIQIGWYKGDPGHQRHSDNHTIYSDWLNETVQRLGHWNFHLISFWLALSLTCDVMLCNSKWEILMITSPLSSNVRHRAMITPQWRF